MELEIACIVSDLIDRAVRVTEKISNPATQCCFGLGPFLPNQSAASKTDSAEETAVYDHPWELTSDQYLIDQEKTHTYYHWGPIGTVPRRQRASYNSVEEKMPRGIGGLVDLDRVYPSTAQSPSLLDRMIREEKGSGARAKKTLLPKSKKMAANTKFEKLAKKKCVKTDDPKMACIRFVPVANPKVEKGVVPKRDTFSKADDTMMERSFDSVGMMFVPKADRASVRIANLKKPADFPMPKEVQTNRCQQKDNWTEFPIEPQEDPLDRFNPLPTNTRNSCKKPCFFLHPLSNKSIC